MQEDRRVTLTVQKIDERLYKAVRSRIKADILCGIFYGVVLLVFGALALNFYLTKDPAYSLVLGAESILLISAIGSLIAESITVSRMKRRIQAKEYLILHDKLIRANENMIPIKNEIRLNTAYRNISPPPRKDEFIFESGMTYVRTVNEKDEFNLRDIMRYSDEPIPFIIVVYRDRPDAPVLLYNERVFRYEEE